MTTGALLAVFVGVELVVVVIGVEDLLLKHSLRAVFVAVSVITLQ
ncbi:hypothetical protein [Burkholderia multivorans]|nr:hypothetical protein [Burkholderia multivorans]